MILLTCDEEKKKHRKMKNKTDKEKLRLFAFALKVVKGLRMFYLPTHPEFQLHEMQPLLAGKYK